MSLLLEVKNLTKQYPTARGALPILSDITFTLNRGDSASIMGPSGSGKSTLLYVLGALEPPTSGTVTTSDPPGFQVPWVREVDGTARGRRLTRL